MKLAIASTLLASAAAFAPVSHNARNNVAVQAEASKSLPFLNRPPLVRRFVLYAYDVHGGWMSKWMDYR